MQKDEIHIILEDVTLSARLHSCDRPRGLVVVAEGKDCRLLKIENEWLCRMLLKKKIATLFTWLLDPPENQDLDIPFDIGLMKDHVEKLTEWIGEQSLFRKLPLGYFAVHTAVAAVVEASITAGPKVRAIVSHCGRPDLAAPRLSLVKPATLLITGSENVYLTELNWQAYDLLQCEKQLVTIEGDPDQFEEVGKARMIARLAADWFDRHFPIAPAGYRIMTERA